MRGEARLPRETRAPPLRTKPNPPQIPGVLGVAGGDVAANPRAHRTVKVGKTGLLPATLRTHPKRCRKRAPPPPRCPQARQPLRFRLTPPSAGTCLTLLRTRLMPLRRRIPPRRRSPHIQNDPGDPESPGKSTRQKIAHQPNPLWPITRRRRPRSKHLKPSPPPNPPRSPQAPPIKQPKPTPRVRPQVVK